MKRKHPYIFVVLILLLSHLIYPSSLSFGETFDDLDQYFEDYFEEDLEEEYLEEDLEEAVSPPKEIPAPTPKVSEKKPIPVISKKDKEPSLPIAPVDSNLTKVKETIKSKVLESKEASKESPKPEPKKTSTVNPIKKALSAPSQIQKKKPVPAKPKKEPKKAEPAKERLPDAIGESYIDFLDTGEAYLYGLESEELNFESLVDKKKEVSRMSVIDRFVHYMIGDEVEQEVIEIRGDWTEKDAPRFRTLKQAIDEATTNHLPIEIAKEKVSLYRKKINKAFRDLFPSITLSVMDQNRGLGDQPDSRTRTQEGKVAFRQPIYQGGALWNKVREEKSNLKSAMAEYHKIFSDLALEVATAYFNLAKTKTMLNYRERLLTKANESLVLSEEKFDASLISEIEHLNVQSQQSQLNHNLQQAREEMELALLEMQKSMNIDLDIPIDVYDLDQYFDLMGGIDSIGTNGEKGKANGSDEDELKIQRLIEMAYENRPEFVIGENKVNARKYAEKAAKGGWLPQANIFVEAGQNREVLSTQQSITNGKWEEVFRLGLEFSWNLWGSTARYVYDYDDKAPRRSGFSAGGKGDDTRTSTVALGVLDNLEQFSKTQELEVATKEAMLEYQLSEKDMVSEVKESYYNFNRAKIQMRSVMKKIKYRQKLVELAMHRSEINEIQISEYLQSEIDLVEERNTFFQAIVDFFVARASLNKAIGVNNFLDVESIPHDLLV